MSLTLERKDRWRTNGCHTYDLVVCVDGVVVDDATEDFAPPAALLRLVRALERGEVVEELGEAMELRPGHGGRLAVYTLRRLWVQRQRDAVLRTAFARRL